MLDQRKYVFIIGAGASNPYNFPLGDQLLGYIRDNYPRLFKESCGFGDEDEFFPGALPGYNDASRLCNAMIDLSVKSIDIFLNNNPIFRDIGVEAIATTILKYEHESVLPGGPKNIETDDWYSFLFNEMTKDMDDSKAHLRIGDSQVTFITFNYDRSLEYFLHRNLIKLLANSGIDPKEINASFNKLKFIHVYGKVGYLPFQIDTHHFEKPIIEYGSSSPNFLYNGQKAAKLIEVMYDKRINNEDLIEARELIKEAEEIYFLGFGFDQKNLELLGFPIDGRPKKIRGTAYGMTAEEIRKCQYIISTKWDDSKPFLSNCKTLELLRNHLP